MAKKCGFFARIFGRCRVSPRQMGIHRIGGNRRSIPRGNGITLEEGDFGSYLIIHDDGRDILVQTDWDFPGLASTFGWTPKKKRGCLHRETDGTIDCPVCGKKVTEFISEAIEYLDKHIGKRVEDPGYF